MATHRHKKQFFQVVTSAMSGLFDQDQAFGRFALVHVLQAAGSSLVTISLAGSLFFSISPDAAKSKVLLYLALTIAPFALVGPALSPLLDRGRQARRTSVAIANGGSAIACAFMSRDIHSLLLFPEAFIILVLGKLYLVARGALVPQMVAEGNDLASTNAKLAVLASLAGFAIMPFGLGLLKIGAPWVLCLAVIVFVCGTISAMRLPRPHVVTAYTDLAGVINEPVASVRQATYSEVTKERKRIGLPVYSGGIVAAVNAMSIARASVGFVAFFLAFTLRRDHASTWWYGVLLVASGAGSLLGSMLVPRLRQFLTERKIIAGALSLIVLGALGAGLIGGLWAQMVLTFVVGIGPTGAKAALDSIIQHNVPPALLGRTFGRTETRLQLMWVIASLIAVAIPFALRIGDAFIASVCLLALFVYLASGSNRERRRLAEGEPRRTRR